MAFTENMLTRSYVTSAAVSQFRFIVMTSGLVAHVGTAGARADAVSITDASASGKSVAGAYSGRVTVTAGGTISKGGIVSSNASGQAIAATTGHIILGTALEDAVSGQVITIDLRQDGTAA